MENSKKYYFIGAGGIGMAALERYFLAKGSAVAGYDRTPSELTAALQREGVEICFTDDPALAVPAAFNNPEDTTVVYTPAVPADSAIMQHFRNGGFRMLKRAAVLGDVTRNSRGLCFAGTHGKTTTSSMCAHILHNCQAGCNAFLGGVLRNYGSNFLLAPESPYSVIEADEFDRSFHHLHPWIALVTATDPDHLDIYGTEEAYLESFAHFTELVQPGGALVVHEGLKLVPRPQPGVATYSYGKLHGDFHAENIRHTAGEIRFDFTAPASVTFAGEGAEKLPDGRWIIRDINLGVPVEINIENAVAALAVASLTGDMDPAAAREAIGSFMGAKRRFEFWLKEPGDNGQVMIDDYAHHPDELRASIASVKALYPGRKLTVAFQPHLYSRTRDFAPDFARALDLADSVILLDIYPAREEPIPGVTSRIIFDAMTIPDKLLIPREKLVETVASRRPSLLLTAGAGNIDLLLPSLASTLSPQ